MNSIGNKSSGCSEEFNKKFRCKLVLNKFIHRYRQKKYKITNSSLIDYRFKEFF